MSRFFVKKRSSGVSAYVESLQVEDMGKVEILPATLTEN